MHNAHRSSEYVEENGKKTLGKIEREQNRAKSSISHWMSISFVFFFLCYEISIAKRRRLMHRAVIGETMFDLLWHKIYNSIIWLHFGYQISSLRVFFGSHTQFQLRISRAFSIFCAGFHVLQFFSAFSARVASIWLKKTPETDGKKLFAKFHRNTQFSATNYTLHLLVIKQIFNHDVFEYKKMVFVRIDKHTCTFECIHIAQQQSNCACSFCYCFRFVKVESEGERKPIWVLVSWPVVILWHAIV